MDEQMNKRQTNEGFNEQTKEMFNHLRNWPWQNLQHPQASW